MNIHVVCSLELKYKTNQKPSRACHFINTSFRELFFNYHVFALFTLVTSKKKKIHEVKIVTNTAIWKFSDFFFFKWRIANSPALHHKQESAILNLKNLQWNLSGENFKSIPQSYLNLLELRMTTQRKNGFNPITVLPFSISNCCIKRMPIPEVFEVPLKGTSIIFVIFQSQRFLRAK